MLTNKEKSKILNALENILGAKIPDNAKLLEFKDIPEFAKFYTANKHLFNNVDVALIGNKNFFYKGELYELTDFNVEDFKTSQNLIDRMQEEQLADLEKKLNKITADTFIALDNFATEADIYDMALKNNSKEPIEVI